LKTNNRLYVFDTSAILTYVENEPGADDIEKLLIKAENMEIDISAAFISIMEVFYITMQEKGEEEALKRINLIQSLPICIHESNEGFTLRAARLKATNRISFADAYIASVAMELDGILVHKDPEFEKLEPNIKELRLPYKNKV